MDIRKYMQRISDHKKDTESVIESTADEDDSHQMQLHFLMSTNTQSQQHSARASTWTARPKRQSRLNPNLLRCCCLMTSEQRAQSRSACSRTQVVCSIAGNVHSAVVGLKEENGWNIHVPPIQPFVFHVESSVWALMLTRPSR